MGADTVVKETAKTTEVKKDDVKPLSDAQAVKQSVKEATKSPDAPSLKQPPLTETPGAGGETVKKEAEETVAETPASTEDKKSSIRDRIKNFNKKVTTSPGKTTTPAKTEIPSEDQVDELIKAGKIREAVNLSTKIEVEKAKREFVGSQEASAQQQEFENIRNESNTKVWESHPEILDIDEMFQTNPTEAAKKAEASPIYSALMKIYKEKPHLTLLPDGPAIAIEMAERRLGVTTDAKKVKEEGRKEEATRSERASAASSVVSSSASSGVPEKKSEAANLSPDQKLVARKLGLTEEEYARNLGKSSVVGADYYERHRTVKRKK